MEALALIWSFFEVVGAGIGKAFLFVWGQPVWVRVVVIVMVVVGIWKVWRN